MDENGRTMAIFVSLMVVVAIAFFAAVYGVAVHDWYFFES